MKKLYHVQYSYIDAQGKPDYLALSEESPEAAHRKAERLLDSLAATGEEIIKEGWV